MKNKYRDHGTVINNTKWGKKPHDDFGESFDRKRKRAIKKKVTLFSQRISNKLWWKSLTEDDQRMVYEDFESRLSNRRQYISSKIENSDEYLNWENLTIESLMNKYKPQVDVRRNFVIDDIMREA